VTAPVPAYPDLAQVQATALVRQGGASTLATYRAVPITTAGMARWAADTAKQLADVLKAVQAEEQSAIGPLNAVIKVIKGWFSFKAEIEATRVHLRDAAFAFDRAAEEASRKALTHAAETGAGTAEIAAAVAIMTPATTGQRANWKWRVVDRAKVPADYWVVDSVRLDALAKAHKADAVVPGIEFYNEPTAVLR
jgi:hypothetical protein